MENVVVNPSFWRGRRVFITGHTGFKGSWLALWLESMGADVTGLALAPPTQPSLFDVAQVGPAMRSILGDVRALADVVGALRESRAEIVFHLAAQPLVRYSYAQPVETYATNVLGTVHLLEAVRMVGGVQACIIITSDKCYENKEWIWGYRENEPMGGHDPYSSSKGCAELVAAAYRHSYFPPDQFARHGTGVATARAGNVIGGGDWAQDRLVPDLIRAFAADVPAVIRNPAAIRPWQHVLEPLSGYLVLAQRLIEKGPALAQAWNFGPAAEDALPVAAIADTLARCWGRGAAVRCAPAATNLHEAHYLKLDCAQARDLLGWQPRWNVTRALEEIVRWHSALAAGINMRTFTLEQISTYQNSQGRPTTPERPGCGNNSGRSGPTAT